MKLLVTLLSVVGLVLLCVSCGDQITTSIDLPADPLSVLFVGDTSFGENYQQRLEQKDRENILKTKGYDYSLANLAAFLKQADAVVANLETPVTDLKTSPLEGKKTYLHYADPVRTPQTLKKHNITAVSLANNHAMDFGLAGLEQTLEALDKQGIQWFGAGMDAAAAAKPLQIGPLVIAAGFEYRKSYDGKYGFYADEKTGGVNKWSPQRTAEQIEEIRRNNPKAFIIAYPHFGKNYSPRTNAQTTLARAMIDAGADIVIGHGAHVFQAVEQYRGRWIIYNLGNFVFNSPGRYQKEKVPPFSFIARLDIVKNQSKPAYTLRLYPIFSDNRISNYQPDAVTNEQFDQVKEILLSTRQLESEKPSLISTHRDRLGPCFLIDVTP